MQVRVLWNALWVCLKASYRGNLIVTELYFTDEAKSLCSVSTVPPNGQVGFFMTKSCSRITWPCIYYLHVHVCSRLLNRHLVHKDRKEKYILVKYLKIQFDFQCMFRSYWSNISKYLQLIGQLTSVVYYLVALIVWCNSIQFNKL